jgi:multidrug efflux pump subunit AcrB
MLFVKVALRQPITIIVMVILILLGGMRATASTPIDMFPNIDIPEVAVVWRSKSVSMMSVMTVFLFQKLRRRAASAVCRR